jgi:hypothetical protein
MMASKKSYSAEMYSRIIQQYAFPFVGLPLLSINFCAELLGVMMAFFEGTNEESQS